MKKSNGVTQHPWDRWFRKRRFRLLRGRDYTCMTHCMSVQVRAAAIKRGLRASVMVNDMLSLSVELRKA